MTLGGVFDGALAAGLLAVGWWLLRSRDELRAVVLFIAFGVLMSLVWARLGLTDVALAEAAIGSGVSGALFLVAVGRRRRARRAPAREPGGAGRVLRHGLPVAVALAGGVAVVWSVLAPAGGIAATPYRPEVAASPTIPGVTNPVTTVLLDLRGYDTLVEMAVLLAVVVAVGALADAAPGPSPSVDPPAPVLAGLARTLAPFTVLVGGYLLWAGTTAPGGAFQAGSVLAGGVALLVLAGVVRPDRLGSRTVRGAAALGLACFLLLAAVTAVRGSALALPAGAAYAVVLLLESALTVSIAAALAFLVAGRRPA